MTYFRQRYHIGRRGAFLLLFGGIWGAIGYGLINIPLSEPQRIGLRPLLAVAAPAAYGWGWVVAACVAVACSRLRGPAGDRWGFYALMLPVSLWGASYAIAAATYDYPRGWIAAATYAALAVAIGLIAGWPEPDGRNTEDRP